MSKFDPKPEFYSSIEADEQKDRLDRIMAARSELAGGCGGAEGSKLTQDTDRHDEKDDLVERCAKVLWGHTDGGHTAPWGKLRDEQRNYYIEGARAVLEAAGVERLRNDLRLERASAANWLRLKLDADERIEPQRQYAAALTAKLEGEKRLRELMPVLECRGHYGPYGGASNEPCGWSGSPQALRNGCCPTCGAGWFHAKDSGQPAGTPSTGPDIDPQVIRDLVTVVLHGHMRIVDVKAYTDAVERLKEKFR